MKRKQMVGEFVIIAFVFPGTDGERCLWDLSPPPMDQNKLTSCTTSRHYSWLDSSAMRPWRLGVEFPHGDSSFVSEDMYRIMHV